MWNNYPGTTVFSPWLWASAIHSARVDFRGCTSSRVPNCAFWRVSNWLKSFIHILSLEAVSPIALPINVIALIFSCIQDQRRCRDRIMVSVWGRVYCFCFQLLPTKAEPGIYSSFGAYRDFVYHEKATLRDLAQIQRILLQRAYAHDRHIDSMVWSDWLPE